MNLFKDISCFFMLYKKNSHFGSNKYCCWKKESFQGGCSLESRLICAALIRFLFFDKEKEKKKREREVDNGKQIQHVMGIN